MMLLVNVTVDCFNTSLKFNLLTIYMNFAFDRICVLYSVLDQSKYKYLHIVNIKPCLICIGIGLFLTLPTNFSACFAFI